jgi:branched-chain amino acid transport system ATP-binding protein
VTGLIGPNGAGKSTLFDVICGLRRPARGRVRLDGRDITRLDPARRARRGMARTFQRLEVFGSLTVFENVLVAAEIRQRWSRSSNGGDRSEPRREAERIVDLVGLAAVSDSRVDSIPTGQARLTELARALATKPRLVLLDEPSSGLDDDESEDFGRLLKNLAAEGLGILLVEHDVDLVMKVCDRIHVLDFGQIIASGTARQVRTNKQVQKAYLGTGAA